ncbi:MAG: hypothetical protein KAH08_03210, partial [Methylococcales bacterium]|nr:hypothetical protein [Methylococcales bacterium]
MTAFENATNFFHACESLKGWEGCKGYVSKGALFNAQCEPLVDINTVEAYCEWVAGFGSVTTPGARYDLHTSSYDESTNTAVFFGTFTGKHTGDGGPVEPTQKETNTHYVYILTMNADNQIEKMVKVWNAP